MKKKLTVLIADDHPAVREGMTELLRKSGITVVAQASDGEEAVAKTKECKPDVVLMDTRMPKKDGLWALERIRSRSPDQRVVILSAFKDREAVAAGVRLKANEYVLKDAPISEIVATIWRVCGDEQPSESSPLSQVKRPHAKRRNGRLLTDREGEILRYVSRGLSNTEIGKTLGISVETVKEHVQNLLRKLDVEDRTQAAVWAVKAGML